MKPKANLNEHVLTTKRAWSRVQQHNFWICRICQLWPIFI